MASCLLFVLAAVCRRCVGRRRRPGWSFGVEVAIAAYRGSWSVMPKMGLVRWRNVGEELSPLQFDGLEPSFVRFSSGAHQIGGAWVSPPDASAAVLLYFHGGGFVFGSLKTHGKHIAALARAVRARTFAIEYRLAPEHPMPAALDDAVAAYRFLLAQGIASERIVLAGDSAGGTLVLNVLLALRDAGLPLPAAGVTLSPWVDLGCSGDSFNSNADYDFVGDIHCRLAAASYLGGAEPRDASPLFADLRGLPPLLVQAGEAEVLIDQIRAFVRHAEASGANLRASIYPDMIHVWHMLRGVTPAAQKAIDEVGEFVRAHVSGATTAFSGAPAREPRSASATSA